ncbi:MAG TPA: thiamine phosphate synthase, partial [Polyangiaceae bacterium]|nr:thiamine phosphate synthase [Polyangiaceae bacterium]
PTDSGCLLFANDRPDLAEAGGADGVHVGQGDMAVEEVRRLHPHLALGLSTHDETQFDHALDLGLDYVALGPIFPTGSKRNAEPVVGLAVLERLAARAQARGVPLVAIGGIHRENLHTVSSHAQLWAVIGALLPEHGESLEPYAEVERRARVLAAPRE